MKILYAIQGTGNGHLSRALEIVPFLKNHAEVDLLISGKASELTFPYPFKYKYHGLFFKFGKQGGVDYIDSIRNFKPIRLIKDIVRCPVRDYDFVISDFEPVSAWAARLKSVPSIALSHQAAFHSPKVPRPERKNYLFEKGMRWMARCKYKIGVHYKRYDAFIFPPIIRKEIRNGKITDAGHICIYLPAFADQVLIDVFTAIAEKQFIVFSKKTRDAYSVKNVHIQPVNRVKYTDALLSAHAVIVGAGFQGTSEALFLKKRMLAVPMHDQYEQLCNAIALEKMGVKVCYRFDNNVVGTIKSWLKSSHEENPDIQTDFKSMMDYLFRIIKV